MPRLGIGMPLSASQTRASVLVIDDPLFESFGGNDIAINYTATRTNSTLYSQDTTQSQWVKTSTGIEGTLYEDPNGGTTGNAITGAASNSTKFIHQVQEIVAGETYTYSAHAKAGNLGFIRLEVSDGTTTYSGDFNLNSNGASGNTTRIISNSVRDMNNGWYRVAITFQALNSSEGGQIRAYAMAANNTPTVNVAVADTVLIYIWGQQLEADAEVTEYIVTTTGARTATTTLVDNSKTWDFDSNDIMPEADPDGEGSWETLPNLVTNGTYDTDSNWSKGTGWTISGGKASSDGTEGVSYLRQNGIVDLTSTYEIKFTVSNSSSGTLNLLKGNASTQVNVTSNGNYTFYTTWDGSSGDIVFQSLNFVGSVDNVSVTEYAITPLDV
tara:strand:- start:329 stop:1480 length:1152 start_codon:yes stop_codon:yes gene_type:complete